jgi:hypothetical protein
MPDEIVMVWIEGGTGDIARGEADSVTAEAGSRRLTVGIDLRLACRARPSSRLSPGRCPS